MTLPRDDLMQWKQLLHLRAMALLEPLEVREGAAKCGEFTACTVRFPVGGEQWSSGAGEQWSRGAVEQGRIFPIHP